MNSSERKKWNLKLCGHVVQQALIISKSVDVFWNFINIVSESNEKRKTACTVTFYGQISLSWVQKMIAFRSDLAQCTTALRVSPLAGTLSSSCKPKQTDQTTWSHQKVMKTHLWCVEKGKVESVGPLSPLGSGYSSGSILCMLVCLRCCMFVSCFK